MGPVKFKDILEDSVNMTWQVPLTDGGKPITHYVIEHREVRKSNWIKSGQVVANILTFTKTKWVFIFIFFIFVLWEKSTSHNNITVC